MPDGSELIYHTRKYIYKTNMRAGMNALFKEQIAFCVIPLTKTIRTTREGMVILQRVWAGKDRDNGRTS